MWRKENVLIQYSHTQKAPLFFSQKKRKEAIFPQMGRPMIYITYSIKGVGEGAMIFVSRTANEKNSKTKQEASVFVCRECFFFCQKKKENDELMGADK